MNNDPTLEVVDNSDLDLTGVPLRDPVIDKQWVRSTITNLYWRAIDNGKGPATPDNPKRKSKELVIELVTEEPATSTDNKPINPGHKCKTNIYASPSGGLTQDMINKKVGRFQVAALGIDEAVRFGSPDQYIGRSVKGYYEAEADKKDASVFYQRVNRWEKV